MCPYKFEKLECFLLHLLLYQKRRTYNTILMKYGHHPNHKIFFSKLSEKTPN